MIIKNEPLDKAYDTSGVEILASMYNLTKEAFLDNSVFFDIETTGFAAKTSNCYLIGCVYRCSKDNTYKYIQWFSDNNTEEILILHHFFEFVSNYKYLVHFNGDGFDIPYLLDKFKSYKMSYDFSGFISIDLFKAAKSLKDIFNLDNYKQKTIESFLGINREDIYNGGQLINVYKSLPRLNILPDKAEYNNACDMLLLHNHDDICALIDLCLIYNYLSINPKDIKYSINDTIDYYKNPIKEFTISFKLPQSVPQTISIRKDDFYIKFTNDRGFISTPIYKGELKHYFPNYKDYYYLPVEDKAIHKSVAFYVDKNYRTQAKANNCYIKKEGEFIKTLNLNESPLFKDNINDKSHYMLLSNSFYDNDESLLSYTESLLKHLLPFYKRTFYHTHNQDHDSL